MSQHRNSAAGVADGREDHPHPGERPSFPVALERFVAEAGRVDLEQVDLLLTCVLHRAMDAMAPSILDVIGTTGLNGFVTQEDVKVRSATSEEAYGPALVLERDGIKILVCGDMHPIPPDVRPIDAGCGSSYGRAGSDGATGSGGDGRPEARVAWLRVDVLLQTDDGPAVRSLYSLGSWHEASTDQGRYWHEVSRAATVTDFGLGFLAFDLLRSALGASAMLDAVRERSVEVSLRDPRNDPRREAPLLTELVHAIAPLDGGIPGPMMMRRLMQVYAAAAVARVRDVVAALPGVTEALVTGGHVSMQDAFEWGDSIRAHAVPTHGGAILHLDLHDGAFEVVATFDGSRDIRLVTLARSTRPHPTKGLGGLAVPVPSRWFRMGTYSVRGGTPIPDGPLPDDLDLSKQVALLDWLVNQVSEALDDVPGAAPGRVGRMGPPRSEPSARV